MRIPFVTSLREKQARPITSALLFALFINALTSAHVVSDLQFDLEGSTAWMALRTRRSVSSSNAGALCKRTRRDIAAIKTIMLRNSRPFSHEIWINNGINLSGPKHTKVTQGGDPELSVDAIVSFLPSFEKFLRVYSRRYRQSVSPRDLRPLVLKVRKLQAELVDLLKTQRPNYSRNSQRVEDLQRNRPALNMADHVTSLLSNLDRSVVNLCEDVTPTSLRDHFALKVR